MSVSARVFWFFSGVFSSLLTTSFPSVFSLPGSVLLSSLSSCCVCSLHFAFPFSFRVLFPFPRFSSSPRFSLGMSVCVRVFGVCVFQQRSRVCWLARDRQDAASGAESLSGCVTSPSIGTFSLCQSSPWAVDVANNWPVTALMSRLHDPLIQLLSSIPSMARQIGFGGGLASC